MSAITIDNDLVHYEVLGRGRPVILVHGWLSSWRYWIPTMQQLSMKYRTYALDLWGYGDSGKDSQRLSFEAQVNLLDEFMERLGIAKAALVGHSLGGAVVVRYALRHPERVARILAISAPMFEYGESAGADASPSPTPTATSKPAVTPAVGIPSSAKTTGSTPVPPAQPAADASSAAQPKTEAAAPEKPQAEAAHSPAESSPTDDSSGKPAAGPAKAGSTGSADAKPPVADTPSETPAAPAASPTTHSAASSEVLSPHSLPTVLRRSPELEAALREAGHKLPLPDLTIKPGDPLPQLEDLTPPALAKLDETTDTKEVDQPNPLRDRLLGLEPKDLLEKHVGRESAHYKELLGEVTKTASTAYAASALSFDKVDLAHDVRRLTSPTLLVHGEKDTFLPPPSQSLIEYLAYGKDDFRCVVWPDTTHFPMLDDPITFHRLVMDFLEIRDLDDLEFKELWKRMVR